METKTVITERGKFILQKVYGKFNPLTYQMSLREAVNFADNTRSFHPIIKSRLYNGTCLKCSVGELDPKGETTKDGELLWEVFII